MDALFCVQISRASIVETYQQFLSSNLLLRQLDMYVEKLKRNSRYKATIEQKLQSSLSAGEYFQALLQLRDDPIVSLSIEALANFDEDRIRKENIQEGEDRRLRCITLV